MSGSGSITVNLSQPAPDQAWAQSAKGRNGYFAPREVSVFPVRTEPKRVIIDVRSKQTYGDPPITLYLTLENAERIAAALDAAIAEAKEEADASR